MNISKLEQKKTLDQLNEITELLEQNPPDIRTAKKVIKDLEFLFYEIERKDVETWQRIAQKKTSKLMRGLKT